VHEENINELKIDSVNRKLDELYMFIKKEFEVTRREQMIDNQLIIDKLKEKKKK
jgi:hypothetical protein